MINGVSLEVDTILGQAQSTMAQLQGQRATLSGAASKIGIVGGAFSTIRTVISAIQRKKNKDSMIVMLVCVLCTFLMFVYWIFK